MLKHIKTLVFALFFIVVLIIAAAVFQNDTGGIKIEVVVHTEHGITASAVETLQEVPTPQKTGYQFCGWYDNPELQGEIVTSLPTRGGVSLYPKWEAQTFAITFDTQGGSPIPILQGEYDTPIIPPEPPNKEGYSFDGWFVNQALTTPYIFKKFDAENITLYAKWKSNPVTITFAEENGEIYQTKTLSYGEAIGTLPQPVKVGYVFAKWVDETGKTTKSTDTIASVGSLVLYAVWQPKTNALILNGGEGQTAIIRVATDEKVVLPQNTFVRDGYNFIGWSADPNGEVLYLDSAIYHAGIEEVSFLYAIWSPISIVPELQAEVFDVIYGEPLSINIIKNTTGSELDYQYKKEGDEVYSPNPPTQAGNYLVKISGTNNGETILTQIHPFTIQKREISVVAGAPIGRVYDGGVQAVVDSTNYIINGVVSGDEPILSWDKAVYNSPRVADASVVQILGISTTHPNYDLVTSSLEIPATIYPRDAKIIIDSTTKQYGDSDPEFTWTVKGLLDGDIAKTIISRETGELVGTYQINGQLENPDYNFTQVSGFLVITARLLTIKADNVAKVYATAEPSLTYSLEGGINNGLPFGETFLGSLARGAGEDTGSYAITLGTLTLPNARNYAMTFIGASFTITPSEAQIYTDAIPTVYQYSGYPQSISGAEADGGGKITYINNSFTSVGSHEIIINADSSRNYKSGSMVFTATVLPAKLVASYMGESIVYGDTPNLQVDLHGFVGEDTVAAVKNLPTIDISKFAVGEHKLIPSGGEADNYIFHYREGSLFVAARPLSIIIDSHQKVFGQPDPAFTYTVQGLIEGDSLNGTLWRDEGESTGVYTIYSALKNANYDIVAVNGECEILPNRITVLQAEWGRITPEEQADIPYGASKTFTVVPDEGYSIAYIIADGITITASVGRGEEQIYEFPSVTYCTTITAVFAPNENQLIFDGNGNTGGATQAQLLKTGEQSCLNPNGFVKEGYIFIGWSDNPHGGIVYADNNNYLMGKDDTYILYACWAAVAKGDLGGDYLTAQKANDTTLIFDGEIDASVPNPMLGAGYWVNVYVEFPKNNPIVQSEINGDDRLIFLPSQDNPHILQVLINVDKDCLGQEFCFDIKWNAAADTTVFVVKVKDTLDFANLYIVSVAAESSDGTALVYSDGMLIVEDGQDIQNITVTFNKNIAACESATFGFDSQSRFSLVIHANTAIFTASSVILQEGVYHFIGYSPEGTEELVFPVTDTTGMIGLGQAQLFSLTVMPPPEPLPFGIVDVYVEIASGNKTQSYAGGVLSVNNGASVSYIEITFSEQFVLGTNYEEAMLIPNMGEAITDFHFVQTGNKLRVQMNTLTSLYGIYQMQFVNRRGAYINVPLTGQVSGESFPGTVLITVHAI